MRRMAALILVALCAPALTGCVERRFVITSDPPGALVLRNGQPLGATPVDDHFTYYGDYDFTLIKEGYETLQVKQHVNTPYYEYFPIDIVSEILVPFQIQDVRRFCYKLEPRRAVNTDQLLQEGQNLRNRGLSLGAPGTTGPLPPPPP